MVVDTSVSGPVSYRGQQAMKLNSLNYPAGTTGQAIDSSIYVVDTSDGWYSTLGFDSTAPGAVPAYMDPPQRIRKALQPNESYVQAYTIHMAQAGVPVSQVNEVTIRYAGRETVTVPAGTFETCRIVVTQTKNPNAPPAWSSWWIAQGPFQGLLAKDEQYSDADAKTRTLGSVSTALQLDAK